MSLCLHSDHPCASVGCFVATAITLAAACAIPLPSPTEIGTTATSRTWSHMVSTRHTKTTFNKNKSFVFSTTRSPVRAIQFGIALRCIAVYADVNNAVGGRNNMMRLRSTLSSCGIFFPLSFPLNHNFFSTNSCFGCEIGIELVFTCPHSQYDGESESIDEVFVGGV
jgi:hypothetical protein